jgi:multicomponent Na+:H+ antiporter subunit E
MIILKKIYGSIGFIMFYLYKLIQSNIYIAWDILTPRMRTNPGFIWVTVDLKSDFGLLLFSNLLSMTPGTLSIDYDQDKRKLLVHYLYNNEKRSVEDDIEAIQSRIKMITN